MTSNAEKLFVADIGNSTIDIGEFAGSHFENTSDNVLASPHRTTKVAIDASFESRSAVSFECDWLRQIRETRWVLGSVNQVGSELLESWLREQHVEDIRHLTNRDFAIPTAIRNPQSIGIDRLAGTTAANRLRSSDRPAIVVDAGTAITVDCISHEGTFLGGMIAPGLQLCADALGKTDQLPMLRSDANPFPPSLIGDETKAAIESGVFWLVAAGIDGILDRMKQELAGPCDVFVTGGSMPSLLPDLARHQPKHCADLVLSGLAVTASGERSE